MIKAINHWNITVTKDQEKDCIKIRAKDATASFNVFLTPEMAKKLIEDVGRHLEK